MKAWTDKPFAVRHLHDFVNVPLVLVIVWEYPLLQVHVSVLKPAVPDTFPSGLQVATVTHIHKVELGVLSKYYMYLFVSVDELLHPQTFWEVGILALAGQQYLSELNIYWESPFAV